MRAVRTTVLSLFALTTYAGFASAQLIRPNSATTTSEFSAAFGIINAINGSGLPAGFGPADPHASYAVNNHWTTRSNQTLGQSATFTFNQPQTLGGIYIWNHRSDVIANNPHYDVTRFDLEFFSGANATGTLLASQPGFTCLADIAAAQLIPFNVVADVRSVRFTIRATTNNNNSQFTGLAEVAFAPCLPAVIASAPATVGVCVGAPVSFSVVASGSGPFQYQWLRNAVPIDPVANPSATTDTLTLASTTEGDQGVYDVVVTNRCNTSGALAAAELIFCPCCPADFDQDGGVTGADIEAFFLAFQSGAPCGDTDQDGGITGSDIESFFAAFEAGGC